ncbi:MAG: hypothetical protein MUC49_22365 [Raineya sp.]|jgi:FtsH-binding integral membrane protein|nr:hypothetical protein [Raineya sp.]
MKYPVFIHVEKPSKVLGMNLEEAATLVVSLIACLVVSVVLGSFVKLPLWFFPAWFSLILVLFFLFRKAGAKSHPRYTLSYIAYHMMQAHVVEPNGQIYLKSLSELQEIRENYKKEKSKK